MQHAQHATFAATLRRLADDTNVSIQLAADRGDSPAALQHREDRNALLDLAAWHEAQAQTKRLSAVDTGAPSNLPGDDCLRS